MAIHRAQGVKTITLNGSEILVRYYGTDSTTYPADLNPTEEITGVVLARNLNDRTAVAEEQVFNPFAAGTNIPAGGFIERTVTLINSVGSVTSATVNLAVLRTEVVSIENHDVTVRISNPTSTAHGLGAANTLTIDYITSSGDDVVVRPTNVTATVILQNGADDDDDRTYDEVIVLKNGPHGGFTQSFEPGTSTDTAVTNIYTNLAATAIITTNLPSA